MGLSILYELAVTQDIAGACGDHPALQPQQGTRKVGVIGRITRDGAEYVGKVQDVVAEQWIQLIHSEPPWVQDRQPGERRKR
jgi:hypothetical protein